MSPRFIAFLLLAAAAAVYTNGASAQQGSATLLSQLAWYDRGGKRISTVGPVANHGNVELSPDDSQVAVAILDTTTGTRDLWIQDIARGTRRKFTNTEVDENWAVWTRDGRSLIFNSYRLGNRTLDLFRGPAVGGMPELLLQNGMWPVSLAPDGRHLLFVIARRAGDNDVMVLPLFGDGRPFPFRRTDEASENWAAFSPDGRWVAYSSTESGQPEVYVAAFPPTEAGFAARQRVSGEGGTQARWARNGREIFYLGQDRSLMVTAVDGSGPTFRVQQMQRLFEPRAFFLDSHGFDVAADGRILVNSLVVSPQTPSNVARR